MQECHKIVHDSKNLYNITQDTLKERELLTCSGSKCLTIKFLFSLTELDSGWLTDGMLNKKLYENYSKTNFSLLVNIPNQIVFAIFP